VLKGDCGASEALPHIWDINMAMTQSCEHKELSTNVMDKARAAYLAKALQSGMTAAKNARYEAEAGPSIGSSHMLSL